MVLNPLQKYCFFLIYANIWREKLSFMTFLLSKITISAAVPALIQDLQHYAQVPTITCPGSTMVTLHELQHVKNNIHRLTTIWPLFLPDHRQDPPRSSPGSSQIIARILPLPAGCQPLRRALPPRRAAFLSVWARKK